MDMDMDVAWCLTCSKRTNERNPYCSENCREQDINSSAASSPSVSISVALPPILLDTELSSSKRRMSTAAQGRSTTPRPGSPPKLGFRTPSRPPVTPLAHAATTSASGSKALNVRSAAPRDRRAFSFPAVQAEPPQPISIAKRRESRNGSNGAIALPFARKTMGVSLTSTPAMQSPAKEGPTGTLRAPVRRDLLRASKSTGGANTPLEPDSVFFSTSESEDEAELLPPQSPLKIMPMLNSNSSSAVPSSVPLSRRSTKSRSSFRAPSSHTSPSLPHPDMRKSSQSPVAQLVASSASSRSREDIISWAKAVGLRPNNGETSDDAAEERGRSRTRRSEALASFTTIKDADCVPDDRAGTTPKGLGSALAGLGIGGLRVGPIVKALTSTISPQSTQNASEDSTLGPDHTQLSAHDSAVNVDVSSPMPISDSSNESDLPPLHFGGATPTLSTASFSELVDPSVTGTLDHAEIATDDNHSTTSYPRRPSAPKILQQHTVSQPILPLRPVTTTATAIWNLSTYFRSFAPFSIASVIAPYAPLAVRDDSKHPSGVATPAPIPEETAEEEAAHCSSPLPASRYEDPSETSLPHEVVKSLPLDIAVPFDPAVREDQRVKVAERHVREQHRSPSRQNRRSRSRSLSRSRGRGMSRQARSPSPAHSSGSDVGARGRHSRKVSYDADGSDDEEDERRGRSRRGKALARDMPERRCSEALPVPPPAVRRLSEGGMRTLGERSGSRGHRGRR